MPMTPTITAPGVRLPANGVSVVRCWRPGLSFKLLEQFDGGQVVAAFLFQGAEPHPVGVGDAVVALVAQRFRLGRFFDWR